MKNDAMCTIKHKVAKAVSFALAITFFVLCCMVGNTCYQTYKVEQDANQLRRVRSFVAEGTEEKDWSNGMLAINPGYAGWLTCYGTKADGPVVQGETNDTYLRTNFYGEKSKAGTLFVDSAVDLTQDGNVIIYGHKMHDDTMFGSLEQYKDKTFFEENGVVLWQDRTGDHFYKIFAVMVLPGGASSSSFVDIASMANSPDAETQAAMLQTIENRASLYRDLEYSETDKYIFLVTCDYTRTDGRLVVVGREVSASEVNSNA